MTKNTQLKVPLHQKIRYSIAGAIAAVAFVLIPAYALVAVVDPTQYQAMIAQMVAQVKNSAEQITMANAQKLLTERLHKEVNTLAAGLKSKLTSAVTDKLGMITNGPVGKLMTNAGITISSVDGPGIAGHVNSAETRNQMAELGAIDNPVTAITTQAKIMLENQLHDRLNVTSLLDEKPSVGACTTTAADKCTILTRLREMDAVSLNSLQATNVLAIGEYAKQGDKFNTNIVSNFYRIAGTTKAGSGDGHEKALFKALSSSPSITLGYERTAEAEDLDKSRWLSHVLVGQKNNVNLLLGAIQLGDEVQQVDAMSKIAKIQIARSAIMNVHNTEQHNSLNAQFRACVVRPDAQDRIGATQEQQLVSIQALLRCSNMIQLQSRQQEMETQRLLGTMLITLLDLYATQKQTVTLP